MVWGLVCPIAEKSTQKHGKRAKKPFKIKAFSGLEVHTQLFQMLSNVLYGQRETFSQKKVPSLV